MDQESSNESINNNIHLRVLVTYHGIIVACNFINIAIFGITATCLEPKTVTCKMHLDTLRNNTDSVEYGFNQFGNQFDFNEQEKVIYIALHWLCLNFEKFCKSITESSNNSANLHMERAHELHKQLHKTQ